MCGPLETQPPHDINELGAILLQFFLRVCVKPKIIDEAENLHA
jgi:hypothetical protein